MEGAIASPVSVDFRQQATTAELSGGGPMVLASEVYDLSTYRNRGEISIGRGLDVDLFLGAPTVSRLHAQLTWSRSGRVYVQHSGGRSPTRVDDATVDDMALEVSSGATLHFGGVSLSYMNPQDFQRMLWRVNSAVKLSQNAG